MRFRCGNLAGHHRYRNVGRILVRISPSSGAMMTVVVKDDLKVWRRRDRNVQLMIWASWLASIALFVYCFHLISERTIWAFVWDAPAQAGDLAARMFPPDWGYIRQLWRPIWDTINIATMGTVIGILLAVPIAFCAARNTTPSRTLVRPVALFIIVASRSINSLIWALMLVTIVGPGVFAEQLKRSTKPKSRRCGRPAPAMRRFRSLASCHKCCPPLPEFRCFVGTSTFASRPCSG